MKEKFHQADALKELENFVQSIVHGNGITKDTAGTLLPILTDMLLTKSDTEKLKELVEKNPLCTEDQIEVMVLKVSSLKAQVMASEADQAMKEGQDLIQRMQLELNPASNRQPI